jgi:hypothetical protein
VQWKRKEFDPVALFQEEVGSRQSPLHNFFMARAMHMRYCKSFLALRRAVLSDMLCAGTNSNASDTDESTWSLDGFTGSTLSSV